MNREENTREGRDRRVIDEEIQLPQTGIVTNVYEHTKTDDPWNFHVDVRIGPDRHPRKVPVAVGAPDLIAPPRSEEHPDGPDLVLVQFMHDADTERPIVTHILYNQEDRAPFGQEGIIRVRRGSLYLELHPQGDWARMAKKSSDDGSPSVKIEIDDQNDTVNIDTGGNDVVINGGGKKVVREGDPVSTSLASGSVDSGSADIDSA